jgi:type IV secretory pathway TraG/TraD family ATPase VirD4
MKTSITTLILLLFGALAIIAPAQQQTRRSTQTAAQPSLQDMEKREKDTINKMLNGGSSNTANSNAAATSNAAGNTGGNANQAANNSFGKETELWKNIQKDGVGGTIWKVVKNNPIIPALIGFFVVGGIIYYFVMYRIRPFSTAPEHKSTGRFAAPDEIVSNYKYEFGKGMLPLGFLLDDQGQRVTEANLLDKNGNPIKKIKEKDGIIVAIPDTNRTEHSSVEAGTGSGKSTTTTYPSLIEDACSNRFNSFIADRKGEENFRDTSYIWRAQGHRVLYLNPWDASLTHCMEPLYGATVHEVKAIVLAHIGVLIDPNSALKIYRDMEERLLTTLILAAQRWSVCQGPGEVHCPTYQSKEESLLEDPKKPFSQRCKCRRHLCTLPALGELINKGPEVTKRAIEKYPDLAERIFTIWEQGKSDIAKFFNGIQNKLGLYLEPDMANAFSRSDFHLKELLPYKKNEPKERGTVLYLGISQSYTASSALLASVVIQLLVNQVFRRRDWMLRNNMSLNDVRLLDIKLDEIFSYAVQNFDEFQAIARSAGCAIQAAFQVESQAKKYYTAEMPDIMRTNFNTKMYLNGCSLKTAKELSDSFGKRTVVTRSQSWGRSGIFVRGDHSSSETERTQEVAVMTVDEIINLPKNQILVKTRLRPFILEGIPMYENPLYMKLIKKSQQEVLRQRQLNELCDSRNEKRPAGQPPKPRYIKLDLRWLGLDKHFDNVVSSAKGDPPANEKFRTSILNKVTWVSRNSNDAYGATQETILANIEKICEMKFQKVFKELKTSEAQSLMDLFVGYEDDIKKKRAEKSTTREKDSEVVDDESADAAAKTSKKNFKVGNVNEAESNNENKKKPSEKKSATRNDTKKRKSKDQQPLPMSGFDENFNEG